jgi:NADH-quinone oxidoreductase subunit J
MMLVFLISGVIAVVTAILAVTRASAVHALLLVTVSILAVALIFFILGAPFVAALEVIIYAGAIMVLLLFVIMLINPEVDTADSAQAVRGGGSWIVPVVSVIILFIMLLSIVISHSESGTAATAAVKGTVVTPKQVGISMFRTYLLGTEMATLLLLAGFIGAYHIGKRRDPVSDESEDG